MKIQNMEQTSQLTSVMSAGFAGLNGKLDAQTVAMNQGFQSIKDYLCNEKIESLQHQVSQLNLINNNNAQTAALNSTLHATMTPIIDKMDTLIGRVPPTPVPSYPAPQYANSCSYGIIPNNRPCDGGYIH